MIKRLLIWVFTKLGFIKPSGVDLFRPKERLLYGYWNGMKTVWEDPLILYKKLMAVGPELSINIKVFNSPMKGNVEASNALMNQIRGIFNVPVYDSSNARNGGLTETELISLLGHFINYCDDVKKKLDGSVMSLPTSPPSVSSSPPVQENPPPTTTTLDSNSTGKETSTEQPTAPPLVSESPSVSSNPPLIILGPTQTERVMPS